MFLSAPPRTLRGPASRGGKRKRKCCGFWERPPEWMEGTLNRAMEESSEPQLDAKSKVRPGLKGTGAAGSEARKTVP